MTRSHVSFAGMLCALLLATLLAPHPAQAQQTKVVIGGGEVRINGKVIPREEWPEGLTVKGVRVTISVPRSGGSAAFSGSDGKRFKVENGTIRPFSEKDYRQYSARIRERSTRLQERSARLREQSERLREQSEELVLQSVKMLNASGVATDPSGTAVEVVAGPVITPPPLPWPPLPADQSALEAAAREAQETYQSILGTYLESVQQDNRYLYERLLDEWGVEIETVQLAYEIRRLPEGDQREELLHELRELLEDTFELKQENRRREVAQLESELEALRTRLRERERQRDRLIEVRIRELLSESQ